MLAAEDGVDVASVAHQYIGRFREVVDSISALLSRRLKELYGLVLAIERGEPVAAAKQMVVAAGPVIDPASPLAADATLTSIRVSTQAIVATGRLRVPWQFISSLFDCVPLAAMKAAIEIRSRTADRTTKQRLADTLDQAIRAVARERSVGLTEPSPVVAARGRPARSMESAAAVKSRKAVLKSMRHVRWMVEVGDFVTLMLAGRNDLDRCGAQLASLAQEKPAQAAAILAAFRSELIEYEQSKRVTKPRLDTFMQTAAQSLAIKPPPDDSKMDTEEDEAKHDAVNHSSPIELAPRQQSEEEVTRPQRSPLKEPTTKPAAKQARPGKRKRPPVSKPPATQPNNPPRPRQPRAEQPKQGKATKPTPAAERQVGSSRAVKRSNNERQSADERGADSDDDSEADSETDSSGPADWFTAAAWRHTVRSDSSSNRVGRRLKPVIDPSQHASIVKQLRDDGHASVDAVFDRLFVAAAALSVRATTSIAVEHQALVEGLVERLWIELQDILCEVLESDQLTLASLSNKATRPEDSVVSQVDPAGNLQLTRVRVSKQRRLTAASASNLPVLCAVFVGSSSDSSR